ncbi:MAG: peroxiredoxin [Myxococcota bacterium]
MGTNPVLSVGDTAPDFTDDTAPFTLSGQRGKRVVLYFYPKDDTPGCTTEACDFRDRQADFAQHDAIIVGCSPDGRASHDAFTDKHGLPFILVADPDKAIAQAYGVWREKKMYGRTTMGIVRSTFVIDPEGRIEAIHDNVRAKGHVARVLSSL